MNYRQIPNLITTARLVLSVVFFALLSWYQYEGRGHSALLTWAFFICLIAILTDYVDGYLARRWKVESGFGRVVDPFVDKILVLGSFVFFAGKNFIIPVEDGAVHAEVVYTITGITPAMVVVILGRELLVTSLRGLLEANGVALGADRWGKYKMALQSVTILAILLYLYMLGLVQKHDPAALPGYRRWAEGVRDVLIWLTLLVTVASAYGYLRRGVETMRAGGR
jgi:CDP-diacylglycerol--glycerol-3-phosphate 3-phosphatidyltransferase